MLFSATEAVGQLSMDMYVGEPSSTSACIDIDIRGHYDR